ncbi:3' terminal RNA ribose 2'-O-methyltransferase Hen1 [Microlunatus elymi]|uniref:Small RNA 2'-O-methyltransferase n=1 Tax=Microlunatus elymi TaxID=2596828 RepID=A0A516PX22_9ACTN|nr:3' terminal RNA ribose 2'-O-methyltransferase Hen1 [Microlunatus elymi]QDP95682.1 3' terminal RNA ribose 2'-O-methyltransferase Hen1 [Microlunatus elymi]
MRHLYVLLPVLGGRKHYWVGPDEVDKLLRAGAGWLPDHPERELIMNRYLAFRHGYVQDATDRLLGVDVGHLPKGPEPVEGPVTQPRRTLAQGRQGAVLELLIKSGARRVVDLGCGEGTLLLQLARDAQFVEILGADASPRALDRAERRLSEARLSERQRERIRLRQSSVTYRDPELAGFDAVVLMEVIEHLDQDRIPDLERTVFGAARPRAVIITTPNRDANTAFAGLADGGLRHRDHRFEWSRTEFARWADETAAAYGYDASLHGIDTDGLADLNTALGAPTQAAVFTRHASSNSAAGGSR